MAHEVIKRVGSRAYRYRVERYRDPQTQKARSRWTYLGVVAPTAGDGSTATAPQVARRAPGDARARLLAAFERLAEREAYAAITAGAVATEAGLAHGTFYRYFRDKRDLFEHAIGRLQDDLARSAPSFAPPYGDREQERLRVRRWLEALFARRADHPGVLRAFYEALENDAALREARDVRRRERIATFATYLSALRAAGSVAPLPEAAVASALLALVEATFRSTAAARGSVDPIAVAGVIAVFDRAIFQADSGVSATPTRSPESKVK